MNYHASFVHHPAFLQSAAIWGLPTSFLSPAAFCTLDPPFCTQTHHWHLGHILPPLAIPFSSYSAAIQHTTSAFLGISLHEVLLQLEVLLAPAAKELVPLFFQGTVLQCLFFQTEDVESSSCYFSLAGIQDCLIPSETHSYHCQHLCEVSGLSKWQHFVSVMAPIHLKPEILLKRLLKCIVKVRLTFLEPT